MLVGSLRLFTFVCRDQYLDPAQNIDSSEDTELKAWDRVFVKNSGGQMLVNKCSSFKTSSSDTSPFKALHKL